MKSLKKQRRIQVIALAFVALTIATVLIGYAFRDGINFFRAPSEIIAAPPGPETFPPEASRAERMLAISRAFRSVSVSIVAVCAAGVTKDGKSGWKQAQSEVQTRASAPVIK